ARIAVHPAKTVGHHTVVMPQRRLPQAVDVIRRWRRKSAAHDHSVAVAVITMAWRAIDVEPRLPALEQCRRQIQSRRQVVDVLAVYAPGDQVLVLVLA